MKQTEVYPRNPLQKPPVAAVATVHVAGVAASPIAKLAGHLRGHLTWSQGDVDDVYPMMCSSIYIYMYIYIAQAFAVYIYIYNYIYMQT